MKKLILLFVLLIIFSNSLYSQWNLMNLGGGTTGPIISTKPGTLFAATELGIYRSTNSTLTWQNVCDTSVASFWRSYPTGIVGRGDTVIFYSYGHVIGMARFYATTNNGKNWRKIEQGRRISSFIFKDNCWLYSGHGTGSVSGFFRSTDVGVTWENLRDTNAITNLWVYNNYIYGSGRKGIFRSTDYGTSWEKVYKENISPYVMGNMLISVSSSAIVKSIDGGINWENTPISAPFTGIRSLTIKGSNIFICDDWDFATYKSIDTGKTWTKLNTLGNQMSSLCVSGNSIYGAYDGVLRSTDDGLTWTRRNTGLTALTVRKVFADGRNIYASTSVGLSVSRNNGTTWSDPYALIKYSPYSTEFTKAGTSVFFATDSLVYRTSNNGYNWTEVFHSYTNNPPIIGSNGTNVYLFYVSDGLKYSSNSGNNWSNIPYPSVGIYKLTGVGLAIICCCDSGVFKSTNLGQSWTLLNKMYFNAPVRDFEVMNSNWYAASDSGIFKSSDNGLSWTNTNSIIPYSSTYDIQAAGNNLYYTTFSRTVYVTTNSGLNWSQLKDESGNRIFSMTANTSYVYCSTSAYQQDGDHTSGVFRHNLSIITNTQNNIGETPSTYRLSQNYPNPFNPITTIMFDIPKVTRVKIAVYDITGREVSVLVNENMQAGSYERQWDGSRSSSGVYFYKITSGDFVQTKKMLLIK